MADDTFAPDPGAVFASDVHRRVLGHLALPSDDFGWTAVALVARLQPDAGVPFPAGGRVFDFDAEADRLTAVLTDLADGGYAREYASGAWRMTKAGLEALTGPNGNEPAPDAEPEGPALVTGPTPIGG